MPQGPGNGRESKVKCGRVRHRQNDRKPFFAIKAAFPCPFLQKQESSDIFQSAKRPGCREERLPVSFRIWGVWLSIKVLSYGLPGRARLSALAPTPRHLLFLFSASHPFFLLQIIPKLLGCFPGRGLHRGFLRVPGRLGRAFGRHRALLRVRQLLPIQPPLGNIQ